MDLLRAEQVIKLIYLLCLLFQTVKCRSTQSNEHNDTEIFTVKKLNRSPDIVDTFNILQEGEEFLQFGAHKDIVLVLGNTGSGKSTLTYFVAGDNNKLKSLEIGDGEFIIIDEGEKIGTGIYSKTVIPERVIDPESNTAYYDCPGFSDTRNAAFDIASTFFIKKTLDHAQSVKLLFTVSYPSVRVGVDRTDFMKLVKHTTEFVKNIEKFKNSIALVVTKVDNEYVKHKKEIKLLSDKQIINKIVKYIKEVKNTLEDQLANTNKMEDKHYYRNAITLLEVFLKKNDSTYTNIVLFRRPDEPGVLSGIELLQEGKKDIKQLVENKISFTRKTEHDFGFTVSDKSKINIIKLVDKINADIVVDVSNTKEHLKEYYRLKMKESNDLHALEAEIKIMHQDLQQTIQELENAKTLKEYTGLLINFLTRKDVDNSRQLFLNMLKKCKYLQFLQLVSNEHFNTKSLEFSQPLHEVVDYVSDSQSWYTFLVDLYNKLSNYQTYTDFHMKIKKEIPNILNKRRKRNVNSVNMNELFYVLEDYKINEINNVDNKSIDEVKLKDLNDVLDIIIQNNTSITCQDLGVLVIKGDFIKFSELPAENPCSGESTSLQIFALNSVFIDEDLIQVGSKLKVFIISPRWEVVGVRKIVLDGATGDDHCREIAAMGHDGKPGLPGGPAGSFFGIAEEIVGGEYLTISANGGTGGAGQHGGQGFPGRNGVLRIPYGNKNQGEQIMARTGFSSIGKESSKYAENALDVLGYIIGFHHNKEQYIYFMHGERGERGKDGARGGAGGRGGLAGNIFINELEKYSKVKTSAASGEVGVPGRAGEGGWGGKSADNLYMQYNEKASFWFNIPRGIQSRGWHVVGRSPGSRSERGRDNKEINLEGINDPKDEVILDNPSYTLATYKVFLLDNLMDNVKKTQLINFYKYLDDSKQIRNIYDSFGLLQELQNIESKFFHLNNHVELQNMYNSLLERIAEYGKQPKSYERTRSHKKLVTYLYTATLSKILSLKNHLDGSLIINIDGYFDMITKNFKNLQTQANEVVKNEYNHNYKKQIDAKINEARLFIEKQIDSDIAIITSETGNKIENLLLETSKLKDQAEAEQDELINRQRELVEEMHIRNVLEVFKFLQIMLDLLGPLGESISSLVYATNNAIDANIAHMRVNIVNRTETAIPQGVRFLVDGGIHFIENFLKKKVIAFGHFLETLFQEAEKYPETLSDMLTTANELKSNLTHLDESQDLDSPKITSLIKKIKGALDSKIQGLLENTTTAENTEILPEITVLETLKTLAIIAEVFTDVYLQHKEDNLQLQQLTVAIQRQGYNIEALRTYQSKIYDVIVPLVKQMHNDISVYEKDLPYKSQVALDISNWQIQSTLKEVKMMFKKITNGFQIEEELISLIDKLDEAMTTTIKIYDRIQNYKEQKEFADYIADISSTKSLSIQTNNKTIDNALNSLELTIKSGIVLDQFQKAVHGFKQFIFPFADYYLEQLSLPRHLEEGTDLQGLISSANKRIDTFKSKLTENKLLLNKNIDPFVHEEYFHSDDKFSGPFVVWDRYNYEDVISRLLSGEEIVLKADILRNMPNKNAVKFNKIELNFKATDNTVADKLKEKLLYFDVAMKHFGNSYFRCDNRFYVLTSESQLFYYSLEKSPTGEPLRRNAVYTKVTNGQYMLSPYATWSFQLKSAVNTSFATLAEFRGKIDLELVGHGQFVIDNSPICSRNLRKYYQTDDTIDVTDMLELDLRS